MDQRLVYIVDKEMHRQQTLGGGASLITLGDVAGLAAGDHGLYVSQAATAAVLRRFQLDTFDVKAIYKSDEHGGFFQLALAPGGVLFVLASRDADDYEEQETYELLALDALSLEVRFTVGKDVLGGTLLRGLAVGGDEVYVGNQSDSSIRVLSLDGKPRRVITSEPGGWRDPGSLCCVADRLYLIEALQYPSDDDEEEEEEEENEARRLTSRRIFVLAPEGRTLQVYKSPRPAEEEVEWHDMCHFDGKLMVADYEQSELLALQGL